jgi:hypothetical protein
MPEKDTKKNVGIVERALKYVYDSVANSGAGETIQRRPRDIDAAVDEMSTGRTRDNQTTDSNNR